MTVLCMKATVRLYADQRMYLSFTANLGQLGFTITAVKQWKSQHNMNQIATFRSKCSGMVKVCGKKSVIAIVQIDMYKNRF